MVTRDQIIRAAVRMVEEGRYEKLTIRSLAASLGVAPMTLYRHVRDRDDILDEVTNELLAKCWRPRKNQSDWREWVIDASSRLRRLLVTHEAARHVYASHPVSSPAAIERMNEFLNVLRQAGLDDAAATEAYATIHTYTIGFSSLEASRRQRADSRVSSDEVERQLAAFTTPRQFKIGLRYIISGIEGALST